MCVCANYDGIKANEGKLKKRGKFRLSINTHRPSHSPGTDCPSSQTLATLTYNSNLWVRYARNSDQEGLSTEDRLT
jgi:hypothetical protein